MKKQILFWIYLCAYPVLADAQITFQRTYGNAANEWGNAVVQCFDGGYVAAGGFGSYGVYVVRTDSLGDTLWTRRFNTGQMVGFDVIQTRDSNFVVSGYLNSFGNGLAIKLDGSGSVIWFNSYPNQSWIQSVCETSTGECIAGGARFMKLDASGSEEWSLPTASQIMTVLESPDSNYVGLGFTTFNIRIQKRDTAGTVFWDKSYPGNLVNTSNHTLINTSDGGYAGAGVASIYNARLWKFDANGDTTWVRQYPTMAEATSIVQNDDGGYALAGRTVAGNDMFLLITDSTGTITGTFTYATGGFEAKSVARTSDGGFILCGAKDMGPGQFSDLLLVKIAPDDIIPTGIGETATSGTRKLSVYPNPVYNQSVSIEFPLSNGSLEVVDACGKIIAKRDALTGTTFTWNALNLPGGGYVLRAVQDGAIVGTAPLVVVGGE